MIGISTKRVMTDNFRPFFIMSASSRTELSRDSRWHDPCAAAQDI